MNEELQEILNQIQKEQDPFSKAKLLYSLKKEKQVSLRTISAQIHLTPSYISHMLRLLKLPPLIIDGYYSNLVSVSHLFILSRLPREQEMIAIYEKVLGENLTSLQTEELVRERLYGLKSEGEYLNKKEVEDFLKKINREDRKVKVIQTRSKGKLILEIDGNLVKTTGELKKIMRVMQEITNEEQSESVISNSAE